MKKEDWKREATLERISEASQTSVSSGHLKQQHGHAMHHQQAGSVREVDYKGRKIRIETSYKITVDGEPVQGHVMVGHNGQVHYHSIPNQEFTSAVDLVKRVIDLTEADECE